MRTWRAEDEPRVSVKAFGREHSYTASRFIEKFLWVVDKRAELVPLKMNQSQEKLYEEICEQRRKGQPVRITIDKSRQQGISTFVAAFLFTLCVTTPNVKFAVLADSLEHAGYLFDIYQRFWDNLIRSDPAYGEIVDYEAMNPGKVHPRDWRPRIKRVRMGRMMEFEGLNSSIRVVVAGETAGRSTSFQGVHGSEVAFWKELRDTMAALGSTVPDMPDTYVFLESTANGYNEFKRKWDDDVAGRTGYKALFLPWYRDPTAIWPVDSSFKPEELDRWLIDKWRDYPFITEEQMNWYNRRYLGLNRDRQLTLQEFPFSDTDSFRTTGSSVFDRESIQRMLDCLKREPQRGEFAYVRRFASDGRSIEVELRGFKPFADGEWRLYEAPVKGHPYILTCDPNNGGSDDSAIQVIDAVSCKQVAVYQSRKAELDSVAFQLMCAGYYYNTGLIASEMNISPVIMEYAVRSDYPRIAIRQVSEAERATLSTTQQRGYKTTPGNRQAMVDTLRIAFREDPGMVVDAPTLREMDTFENMKVGNEGRTKAAAARGQHDDLVTALMAAVYIRNQPQPDFDCSVDEARYYNPFLNEKKVAKEHNIVDWRKAIW